MRDTWNMTPDEARKYILQNWFDGDENVNSFVCGDKEYTAMAIAVEALEATKWHYPSKGELPDDNEIVLLSIKGRVWKRMEFGQWNGQFFVANDSDYSTKEILAWQYIVPPKEEE